MFDDISSAVLRKTKNMMPPPHKAWDLSALYCGAKVSCQERAKT